MTKIYVNTIKPQTTGGNVSFLDPISANGKSQWVDTYGIIKSNSSTISDTVIIPSGTNGLSAGPITISAGSQVTVQGEWSILK
tara:strand:- start:635 stop:883 length:249 start_codon:yes stop_codon:yes gene_type:complete